MKQLKALINAAALLGTVLILTSFLLSGCKAGSKRKDFPGHELHFIIPNGIGSTNDQTTRALIPGLKEYLGENVIPENNVAMRGGAAFTQVANTDDLGYYLYFNSQTVLLMPYAGMPENKIDKLVPVAQVVEDWAIIFVKSDSQWETMEMLIEHIESTDGKLRITDNGIGALWHIAGKLFSKAIGADFEYVSYYMSSQDMLSALVNGDVDISINGPSEAKAFLAEGTIRPLAVIGVERLSSLPDVPTCKELGIDIDFPIWRGIFTTAGTDEETLQILSDAIQYAVKTDVFIKFNENGMPIKFRNYKEFNTLIQSEQEKYEQILKEITRDE